MQRRARVVMSAAAALGLLLTACADGPSPLAGPNGGATDEAPVYDCFGTVATLEQLETAPTVAELDDHPAVPRFAEYADGDLDAWRAVEVEDDRLAAISELDPPDEQQGEVRDHQRLVIEQLDEPAPPETDDEGWMVASSGPCALRAELGELGAASVHLDGEAPGADATELELLVVEQACASGEDAEGRVAVDVEVADDELRLVVGVEPRGGDQACPSNPATPVTVELDEPVGERKVVDAGRYPPVELTDAPDDLPVAR